MTAGNARDDTMQDEALRRAVEAVRRRDAALVGHLDTLAWQFDRRVASTGRQVKSGLGATAVVAGTWMLLKLLRPAPRTVRAAPGERVVQVESRGMGLLGTLLLVASTVWPMLSQGRQTRGVAPSPLWQFADAAMGLVRTRRWRR